MIGIIQEMTNRGWDVVFPATNTPARAFIVQAKKGELLVAASWTKKLNLDDALGELLGKVRDTDLDA